MNWVGGGLQRHSRGNNSDVKKQKAFFAHARNSRRTLSHAQRQPEGDDRINTSLEGDANMTTDAIRPAKVRKTNDSRAIDPLFCLPNGDDPESIPNLEASKQQLLAFDDWLGLGVTEDINTYRPRERKSPTFGKRRRKREHPPVFCSLYSPKTIVRGAPCVEEDVSVRVGTDALATSPVRIGRHIKHSIADSSNNTGQRITQRPARSERQSHGTFEATYRSDPQQAFSTPSRTSRHAASTSSSDEILFDQPCNDSNRDTIRNQSGPDAELYLLSDSPEEPDTVGEPETNPAHGMPSRIRERTSDATTHKTRERTWSTGSHWVDRDIEATKPSCRQACHLTSASQPFDHDSPLDIVKSLVPSTGQDHAHKATIPRPETRPASPNSVWKRFIFGPGSPSLDNAELLHASPTRQSESTSQLSLAARVSSSSSPHHPTQVGRRTENDMLDRLSMVAQPGRARTREVVEISSCASSDVEDSETESDMSQF